MPRSTPSLIINYSKTSLTYNSFQITKYIFCKLGITAVQECTLIPKNFSKCVRHFQHLLLSPSQFLMIYQFR